MITVTVSADIYCRLIDKYTTPTDRMIFPDRGKWLADGRYQVELPEEIEDIFKPFSLEGENLDETIARLFEITEGRIS